MNKHRIHNLIIFIVIALGSGWIGVIVDSFLPEQPEGNSLGLGLWLTMPFLTGIILRIISRDRKDMGLRPNFKGNGKWYLLSVSIYLIVTVITIGLACILGSADISGFEIKTFLSLALFSTAGGFVKNIFEEFAWRGYLTPKLIELNISDWLVYGISGIVWALFHMAYYLFFLPDSYFTVISRSGMALTSVVLLTCWAVMYVEIYRLTKSVWPCVLMHAIEDAFPTVLTTGGFILFTRSGDLWFNPNSGIIAIVIYLGIGLCLRSVRIKRDKQLLL